MDQGDTYREIRRRLSLPHGNNVAAFLPDYKGVINRTPGPVAVPSESLKLVNPAFAESIAPTPLFTPRQAGIPNSLRYSQKTDFAPRIGFPWCVTLRWQDGDSRRLGEIH
jgi:hypothetical protein